MNTSRSTATKLVILGGGAFGRDILDVIEAVNARGTAEGAGPSFEVVGVLDKAKPEKYDAYEVPYLGGDDELENLPADVAYVIGIGSPSLRRRLDQLGLRGGRTSPVIVHPNASISRNVNLGSGTIVCSHTTLTNHITLGRHVHVNVNSTIGHDTTVGDYVTISPMVAVSGRVRLGDGSFLGTGTTVNEGLAVGAGAVVGAGAAVIRDIEASVTAVGVPARVRAT